MADPIKVEGLDAFRKSLKALDSDLPKVLRVAFNRSADIIVNEARPKIPSRSGRARASVKARSSQSAVRIVGGSKRVPYYPWLDFGGRVGRRRSVRRPFLKDGRYIYDSYFRNRERFTGILVDELVDVGKQAGLEIDHG